MVDQGVAAYLAGDSTAPVTDARRVQLDAILTVLADPAVWMQPDPDLETRLVMEITAGPLSTRGRDTKRVRSTRYLLLGVAAALIVAGALTGGLTPLLSKPAMSYATDLVGTPLAVKASGHATLTQTSSGWRIDFHASGLPRRDGGE